METFGDYLAKNEADMIVETLVHGARWSDPIFVFDNGSTDGTSEKVRKLAEKEPRIVPHKSSAIPYPLTSGSPLNRYTAAFLKVADSYPFQQLRLGVTAGGFPAR